MVPQRINTRLLINLLVVIHLYPTLVYANEAAQGIQSNDSGTLEFHEILQIAAKAPRRLATIEAALDTQNADIAVAKASIHPEITFSSKYTNLDRSQISSMMMGSTTRTTGTSFDWQVAIAQPLYSFGRFATVLKIATITEDSLPLQEKVLLDEYILKVIRYWGDALMARDQREISTKSLGHLAKVLELTKIESLGGSRDQIDLLRAKAALQTVTANQKLAEIHATTTLLNLKILLDFPDQQPFNLSESKNPSLEFLQYQPQKDAQQLPKTLQIKKSMADIAELQVEYENSFKYPSLSLFAAVSGAAWDISPSPLPKASPTDSFKSDRHDYALGIRFDWLLYNGFRASHAERKQAAIAKQAALELDEAIKINEGLYRESEVRFKAGKERYAASRAEQEASSLAFNRAQSDYQSGTIRLTDLLEAEKNLREAEAQLTGAWIDWILAAATFRLASGQSLLGAT